MLMLICILAQIPANFLAGKSYVAEMQQTHGDYSPVCRWEGRSHGDLLL